MAQSKKGKGKSCSIAKFFGKKFLKSNVKSQNETNVDKNQNARRKESTKFDPGQSSDKATFKKRKKRRFFRLRKPKQKNEACSVSIVLSSSEAIISPPELIEVADDDTKSLSCRTNTQTFEKSSDNGELNNCVSPNQENQIFQYDAATVGRLILRKNGTSGDSYDIRSTRSFSSSLSRPKLLYIQPDVNDLPETAYPQLCRQRNHRLQKVTRDKYPGQFQDSVQHWRSMGDVRQTSQPVTRSSSYFQGFEETCWVSSKKETALKTKSMADLMSDRDAAQSNSKDRSRNVSKIRSLGTDERNIVEVGNGVTRVDLVCDHKERARGVEKYCGYNGPKRCVKDSTFSSTNVTSPSHFLYNFTGDDSLGFLTGSSLQMQEQPMNPTKSFETSSVASSNIRRDVELKEQSTVCETKPINITSKRDCEIAKTLSKQRGPIGSATSRLAHCTLDNVAKVQIDDRKVSRSRSRARNIAKRFGGSAENLHANSLTLYKANNWGAEFEPPEGYCKMKPLLQAADHSELTIYHGVENESDRKKRQPGSADLSLRRQNLQNTTKDYAIPAVGDTFYYGRRPLSTTFVENNPVIRQTTQASNECYKRTGRLQRPKVFYELDV